MSEAPAEPTEAEELERAPDDAVASSPDEPRDDAQSAPSAASPEADKRVEKLSEGSRFGAYLVGPCIARGGMARIYRAEHEGLRRHVALKVMSDALTADAEMRERFLREARIAAAIKHPSVVNIFDVGIHHETPYLVMELLEGQDLESLLERRGALDESTIVDLILPVVAGLIAVHDAGVVHRDLKPANIFLARGRNDEIEPKLLDFGISKAAGIDQLKLTSANKPLMGTPFYLSPEALEGGEVTALSDQYSLGVVLYECATGVNPFVAATFPEVFRAITAGKWLRPREHDPRISERLSRIVERAMSRDPARRYANLRQLGQALIVLAGQRTRITWALSFGVELGALVPGKEASAARQHAEAARVETRRPTSTTWISCQGRPDEASRPSASFVPWARGRLRNPFAGLERKHWVAAAALFGVALVSAASASLVVMGAMRDRDLAAEAVAAEHAPQPPGETPPALRIQGASPTQPLVPQVSPGPSFDLDGTAGPSASAEPREVKTRSKLPAVRPRAPAPMVPQPPVASPRPAVGVGVNGAPIFD